MPTYLQGLTCGLHLAGEASMQPGKGTEYRNAPSCLPLPRRRCTPLLAQPLWLWLVTRVSLGYSSVTAASDTAAGTPLVPGLGQGATWGLFSPRTLFLEGSS